MSYAGQWVPSLFPLYSLFPQQWLAIKSSKTFLCFIFLGALILFFFSSLLLSTLQSTHGKQQKMPTQLFIRLQTCKNFDSRVLSYSNPGDREGKDLAKKVKNLHAAETVLVFPSPALVYPEMEITQISPGIELFKVTCSVFTSKSRYTVSPALPNR